MLIIVGYKVCEQPKKINKPLFHCTTQALHKFSMFLLPLEVMQGALPSNLMPFLVECFLVFLQC